MKTIITTTAILILSISCFMANAQIKLGASAGISSSKAKSDLFPSYDEIKSITKFPITLDAVYSINKIIGIGSGLWLNTKGIKVQDNYNAGGYKAISYNINYITLPLYMQVSLKATDKINVCSSIGIYKSFATGGTKITTEKSSTSSSVANKAIDFDQAQWSTGDNGLLLGFSLEYKFKNGNLFLKPGYQSGFTDIDKGNYIFKNRLTTLSLGYLVTINSKPAIKK
jgi:hypothetical protein